MDEQPTRTNYARVFATGASRDLDDDKLDYEACLSPLVLRRYAEYARAKSLLPDGTRRPQDNWQLGFPAKEWMRSMWRHFWDVWAHHRGVEVKPTLEESLCALLFNVQGDLHRVLVEKQNKN